MALRTLNLDTTIRFLIEGDQDTAKHIADISALKLKHLGLAQDMGKAVRVVPMHPRRLNPLPGHKHGRPNPLYGQRMGARDWNSAGIVDWIDSVPKDVPADDDPACADVKTAHEQLAIVHATAAARCGQQ